MNDFWATTQTVIQSLSNLDENSFLAIQNATDSTGPPQLSTQAELRAKIKDGYRAQKLVPVLGAGVSKTCGAPDWRSLLQQLLFETFDLIETRDILAYIFPMIWDKSPLVAARYLKSAFQSSRSPIAFEKEVHRLLYANIVEQPSPLISAIADLCIAYGNNRPPTCVITYNYDDLLEQTICALAPRSRCDSVFPGETTVRENSMPIYHVHGYLPQHGRLTQKNRLVLSEDAYHQQYEEHYGWSNLIQIGNFKDKTCFFVGLSLTDPNLRRLLEVANNLNGKVPRHVLLQKRQTTDEVQARLEGALQQEPEVKNAFMNTGIDPSEFSRYIGSLLTRFDEQDVASLGVEILWTDSYDEFADIVNTVFEE